MRWNLVFGPTSDGVPADFLHDSKVVAELSKHLDPSRLAVYQHYLDYIEARCHAPDNTPAGLPGWQPRCNNV